MSSDPRRFDHLRDFLKDHVRQRTDFSQTPQHRGEPAPDLQQPCPATARRITLPDGPAALEHCAAQPLAAAILRRESCRRFAPHPISFRELAALTWGTQGVRKRLGPHAALRTVPSAGARHSFETYLAVHRVEHLAPGLYRYLPFEHQLAELRLADDIAQQAARACLDQRFVAEAALTFFWTTLPARMEWRYGEASHKVIALDAGHLCQNLYLLSEAMGAGTCAIAAYDQDACDALLGVDGRDAFTVYVAAVGKRA